MKQIEIKISCFNCIHCKYRPYDSFNICHKNGFKEFGRHLGNDICKYWKPSVKDVQIWINRSEENK